MIQPDRVSALDEAAARWAVRVDAGTLTADEEAALDAWTAADPRHAGAFARAMAANAYLERAAALGAGSVVPGAGEAAPDREQPPRAVVSRRAWLGGGAGAIAASLLAIAGVRYRSGGDRIQTALGNIRRTALADGSAVTLNTNAAIDVSLQASLRRVRLLAGEVNFDVARDRARPFVVDAGQVRIAVVGTSFLVRLLDRDGVAVTVREGIVDVSRGSDAPIRLTAGDRITLHAGADPEQQHLAAADIDRLGLWQTGQIDLTGMTLGDAAAEFARYSDQHILISDPSVARMKVAGVYSTSDPAGFAEAAAESMDLRMARSPGAILLSRAP